MTLPSTTFKSSPASRRSYTTRRARRPSPQLGRTSSWLQQFRRSHPRPDPESWIPTPEGPGSAVAFAVSTDGSQTFHSKIIFAARTRSGSDSPAELHPVHEPRGRPVERPAVHSLRPLQQLEHRLSPDAGERRRGKTFRFANFNIPGALDPTLVPVVQPGTFEDCGDGGFRLAIVQGNNIGGG